MKPLEYLNLLLSNVYVFIPNIATVPDKQELKVREDYRNIFHLNTEVRARVKDILVSDMLARNDVIISVLVQEYLSLEDILKKVKTEYSKLNKHQCTQKELKDFLEMYDSKKAIEFCIKHVGDLAERLNLSVDLGAELKQGKMTWRKT